MDSTTAGMLAGRKAPGQRSPFGAHRLVRVYLCSTGTDSNVERTAFVERVYPRLREYCRHRYGMEFQVVDLTWGISAEQQIDDPELSAMKMKEILACQRSSCGPCFLALLGQKYGPRVLPDSLQADQYQTVLAALNSRYRRSTRNSPLLDHIYVMDINHLPPIYVRRPPTDLIPDLLHEDDEVRQNAREYWQQLQNEACILLHIGQELALPDRGPCPDVAISELEKEIRLGVKKCDRPDKRCILIQRTIVDLNNYVEDSKAWLFTDLSVDEHRMPVLQMDELAKNSLLTLKEDVKTLVPASNVSSHDVLWRYDNVIEPDHHQEYLQKLCTDVYDMMQRLVDQGAESLQATKDLSPEMEEVAQHWNRCQTINSDFFECQMEIQQLRQYVTESSDRPLVLYGPRGSGKTKLVSRLAMELAELTESQTVCVVRYVGYTWRSDNVCQLLHGLCVHLCRAVGYSSSTIPVTPRDLFTLFPRLLAVLPAHLTVLILLDDLGQMRPDDEAHLMQWLPTHLPSHVKLVVTLLSDQQELLQRLQTEVFADCPSTFLYVSPLSLQDAHSLLNHFMSAYSRQITPQQMLSFSERFEACSCPLYIKLVAMEARTLHSFTVLSGRQLPNSGTQAIDSFFERLESSYGRTVVSRTLAYIVCSGTGLSDLEMEDVLSLDDLVLTEVFSLYRPPLLRLPPIVWLKIRQQLEPFLVVQEVDGVAVTVFEHDSFVQAVTQRYLHSDRDRSAFHSLLADYFLGTWAGTTKPLPRARCESCCQPCCCRVKRCSGAEHDTHCHTSVCPPKLQSVMEQNCQKQPSDSLSQPQAFTEQDSCCPARDHPADSHDHCQFCCKSRADRLVPSQPLVFPPYDQAAEGAFNKRAFNQIPRHLRLSGRLQQLKDLVLFNYLWLYKKMKACSIHRCLEDFAFSQDPEAQLVMRALQAAMPTIQKDLNNLAAEMTGRLLPFYRTHPNIRTLIDRCDLDGLAHCALLPAFPYRQGPGSPLQHTFHCPACPDYVYLVFDDQYLLCKKRDMTEVYVLDMVNGQLKDTVFTSKGELHVTPNGRYLITIDTVTRKSFKVHEAGNGEFLGQIIPFNYTQVCSGDFRIAHVSVTDDRLCSVFERGDFGYLVVCEIPSGNTLLVTSLDGRTTVSAISPDGLHVLCNGGLFLVVHHLYSLHHVGTVHLTHRPHVLAFTADGTKAFISTLQEEHIKTVVLQAGRVELGSSMAVGKWLQGDVIRALRVAPSKDILLVRSNRHLLLHHCSEDRILAHFPRPSTVPEEFKFPKSQYMQLVFTHAEFTKDSECVVAALFRNIYIWQIADSQLLSTIKAPIGIISSLLVGGESNQVVTCLQDNPEINVWTVDRGGKTINDPDRLTAAPQHVLLTKDNDLAFVSCRDSDEVAVFDMQSGSLQDLLTHECKVQDMTITPSGKMVLVVVTWPRLTGTASKLWDLKERRVIREWGYHVGPCLSFHSADCLVYFSQPNVLSKDPYDITVLHLTDNPHCEQPYPGLCKSVRLTPVVTYNDRFLVVSSEKESSTSPCLLVFDMESGMACTSYDAQNFGFGESVTDIQSIQPCPRDQSTVAVIVTYRKSLVGDSPKKGNVTWQTQLSMHCLQQSVGFFLLNVESGQVSMVNVLQELGPRVGRAHFVFSPDFTLCVDSLSVIHNLADRTAIAGHLSNKGVAPACLALDGSVVVYFSHTTLRLIRLHDAVTLACCDVHGRIVSVTPCSDQRTLLVSLADGAVASYVIVDPALDNNHVEVVKGLKSRRVWDYEDDDKRESRVWDRMQEGLTPAYSRPPSAQQPCLLMDKKTLRQVEHLDRLRLQESVLKPVPCKCVRRNARGHWERVKVIKPLFRH